ncbi:hypothetical protein MAR_011319, partial [Mya arenaria]
YIDYCFDGVSSGASIFLLSSLLFGVSFCHSKTLGTASGLKRLLFGVQLSILKREPKEEGKRNSSFTAAMKRDVIDYKRIYSVGRTESSGEDITGGASASSAGVVPLFAWPGKICLHSDVNGDGESLKTKLKTDLEDEKGSESDGEVAVMLDKLEQLEREERRLRRQKEKEELRLPKLSTADLQDECGSRVRKHRSSKKSGIKAKSADKVKHTQKYPHSQLRYEFVTQNIEFENLTFSLFVAGELEIISDLTLTSTERNGRINYFEGDRIRGEKNRAIKNLLSKTKETWKYKNYKGVEEFPIQCKAIIGPFKGNPFSSNLLISTFNSVPKQTIDEKRVILDLCSVTGCAVNDFVLKDCYLGDEVSLVFPKDDDFVQLVMMKGNEALISSAQICQRVTNAIAFIMLMLGAAIVNYLNDLAGVEKPAEAV